MALAGPSRLDFTSGEVARVLGKDRKTIAYNDSDSDEDWASFQDGPLEEQLDEDLTIIESNKGPPPEQHSVELLVEQLEIQDNASQEMNPLGAFAHLTDALQYQQAIEANSKPGPSRRASMLIGRRFSSILKNFFTKPSQPTAPKNDCIACQEPISHSIDEILVPCGHYYDAACIASLFRASMKDEALFPPRCCKKPIPVEDRVEASLGRPLVREWRAKELEFSCLRRVYCADPRCSRFLGAEGEGNFSCVCGKITCAKCKSEADIPGELKHDCTKTQNHLEEAVLALGKEEGWARCPGCRAMIELYTGCYHLTCVCKAEFCYLCEATWKTCPCTQWDETRLVQAAEERIDVQLELEAQIARPAPVQQRWGQWNQGGPHVNPHVAEEMARDRALNREAMVQAAVEQLRVNHDCAHERFRYMDGGGQCSGCSDVLDRYVYHCMNCHLIACNRCRFNRF